MRTRNALNRGLTLVELLVALAIVGLILTIALPSFGRLLASTRLDTARYNITSFFSLARQIAISEGKRVLLCPSSDQQQCTDNTLWHQGIIVFQDGNANRRKDPGEQILLVNQSLKGEIRVLSSRYRRKVSYLPSGRSGGSNLTMTFCHERDLVEPEALILSNTGRVRHTQDITISCAQSEP